MHAEFEEMESIAIVGMAARYPGASNVAEFWDNVCAGVESIAFFDVDELVQAGNNHAQVEAPGYVRSARMLEDFDRFDAAFFGIPPSEAEILDPQFRLFLECSWEALEDAACDPGTFAGLIGVFAGIARTAYLLENIVPNYGRLASSVSDWQIVLGNHPNYLTNRVSYKLNLRGPSLSVQTACSTSLVATHLACQSLLTYRCDMALAGGVSVVHLGKRGYLRQEGGLLSPDGHCRPFDARAQGTVFGDGIGVVALKRLSDALADGDHVYALIKGTAVNNDGAFRVGFTAPSAEGQMEVVSMALAAADVDPSTIGYVEAHGTGTALGDPIEMDALDRAFREYTDEEQFCAVGSVKGNIGHADAAAGVAGLIKTALALKHGVLPPSINYEAPNPEIDFEHSPFYVNIELRRWRTDGQPRRAGVSSFGMGGTNAHAVLEEAPPTGPSDESRCCQLVLLSARTELALERATDNLAGYLRANPNLKLADVAYTLQAGRRPFGARRMVVCRDVDDAADALEGREPGRVLSGFCDNDVDGRPVAFMFPGLGDQYVNMASGLYRDERVFREYVDRCSEMLLPDLGFDLRDVLFPGGECPVDEPGCPDVDLRRMIGRAIEDDGADPAVAKLNQTHVAHAALFTVEYALAQLWMSWGITPRAVIGYSLGEYVAACLAGVFSLEQALRVVFQRARMIEALPEGAMLAIALPEADVVPYLDGALSLSAINGPQMCVVSGTPEDVRDLSERLSAEEVVCRPLRASRAFHSQMVEPMLEGFHQFVAALELNPPEIPYVSNVTGTWITPEQATAPDYWATHTRQPVRFADGVRTLWEGHNHVLLEVGVGQTLGSLALQHPAGKESGDIVVLSSLPSAYDRQAEIALMLRSLGQMWLAGVRVDWSGLYADERRRRCSLPTYPFERERYWIDPPVARPASDRSLPETREKKPDVADWFYVPTWRRVPLVSLGPAEPREQHWLFFVDACEVGAPLVERLRQRGRDVTVVRRGDSFRRLEDDVYAIDPRSDDDYAALIGHLYLVNKPPSHIVHMWSVTAEEVAALDATVDPMLQRGFYSLLALAQALGNQKDLGLTDVWIVSNGMQDVLGGERVSPPKAALLGPCKVIPKEYEQIRCASVDVRLSEDSGQLLTEQLLEELLVGIKDDIVAYRGRSRWVQSFEPIRLEHADRDIARLREKGVYLITGGFGGLGYALAERLARTRQARLILVGRTELPPRESWSARLDDELEDERVRRRIERVLALEEDGAEVLVATGDVADRAQMRQAVDAAHDRFGPINGVFHVAGVPGEGLIQVKTREMAARVLSPKIQGTLALHAVLQDEPLDFMVFYSSSSAVTGRLGEVDYCAANAFLDAFAHYNSNLRSLPTFSINWGPWRWDAWEETLSASLPQVYERLEQMRETYGITFDEGQDALMRVISAGLPQVLVLVQDLQTFVDEANSLTSASLLDQIQAVWQGREKHPRPNLRTAYVPPRDETEEQIARIWAECLAVDKVGIHDHFFELGGNSLMGMMIISRLEQDLGVKVSSATLYEGPTVSALYEVLYPQQEGDLLAARDQDRSALRKELGRKRRRRKRVNVRSQQ
jgi:acyl transferase domain-containing protein/acyl carrier protein